MASRIIRRRSPLRHRATSQLRQRNQGKYRNPEPSASLSPTSTNQARKTNSPSTLAHLWQNPARSRSDGLGGGYAFCHDQARPKGHTPRDLMTLGSTIRTVRLPPGSSPHSCRVYLPVVQYFGSVPQLLPSVGAICFPQPNDAMRRTSPIISTYQTAQHPCSTAAIARYKWRSCRLKSMRLTATL